MKELLPRRSLTPRAAPDPAVPLINLVFLLLAFFLIMGTLARQDPIKLAPPPAPGAEHSGEADIYIDAAGTIYNAGGLPLVSGESLFDRLKQEGHTRFALKADADAPANVILKVIEQGRKQGFAAARLVTERSETWPPQAQNK